MSQSTKRLISIFSAFTLLIGALIVVFQFIFPAYHRIQKLRGKLSAEVSLLKEQENAFSQVKRLSEEYKGMKNLENSLAIMLPLEPKLAEYLNQYYGLAEATGVTIQSLSQNELGIKPSKNKLAKGLGRIRFKIKVVGFYNNLKKFIEAIETNVYLSNIEDLRIEPVKAGGKIYFVNLEIDNYYQAK